MAPATLYIWGLGPLSRNWKFSPTPWSNWNSFGVPSSTQGEDFKAFLLIFSQGMSRYFKSNRPSEAEWNVIAAIDCAPAKSMLWRVAEKVSAHEGLPAARRSMSMRTLARRSARGVRSCSMPRATSRGTVQYYYPTLR